MKFITACFCVHCQSQVRPDDEGVYIGYTPDCACMAGLDKKDIRRFSLKAKSLKQSYGFVLENNNSMVTYHQATDRYGRFAR